jgi:malonyl CoA-acyl carrier protein transacylase
VKQRIPVSGAFHTSLMEEAGQKLYRALKKENFVTFEKPHLNVFSNYSGGLYKKKPAEMKKLLIKQVSEPVKWEQIQQGLFHRKKVLIIGFEFLGRKIKNLSIGPFLALELFETEFQRVKYANFVFYTCCG